MTTLSLDIETFCETPIKNGTHRYAEGAEVLLVQVAIDDGPVAVWDLTLTKEGWKSQLWALQGMIDTADEVVIHNSAFERTVLRQHGVTIPLEKITDTMVLALQHGLPGSLDMLCDILGVEADAAKLKDGKKLIQLFTKPRPKNMKVRRATRETHPDEWQRFIEYAERDVDAMRAVLARLPRWNDTASERELWRLDQAVNDRGIAVDVDLAVAAVRAFDRTSRTLAATTADVTAGAVTSTTQRAKLMQHLRDEHDFVTADMTKGTVEFFLRDAALDPAVRELLELRQQASATSPSKYKALIGAVSSDNRLRGTLQFCGAARTGRDAGRIFQPQNLPRTPDWFDGEVQAVTVAAFKADCEDLLWANISERCAFAVRGCMVAAPNHKFVMADLSNIEGRVLAWGAGEQWKLDAFKAFDCGTGHDLYKVTAGRILGKDPGDVTKPERQSMGKVPELACLGPDTVVLTNNGEKPITKVTTEDLLWDGEEWVRHGGLIDRGSRETIWVAGLEATPDHELLVGRTWLSALTVASCRSTLDLALVTGLESLPWSVWTSGRRAAYERLSWSARAAHALTEWPPATCEKEPALVATAVPRSLPEDGLSITLVTPPSALMTRIDDGFATVSRQRSIGATTRTTARTTTTAGGGFASTRLGARIAVCSSHIWSSLKAGISQNWKWTVLTSTGTTSREISVSSGDVRTGITSAVSATYKPVSRNLRPVYDIADAGPRNRFTVLTEGGAFIVHNCGFQGGVGAFRKMGGQVVEAMTDEEIQVIVKAWRDAHPRIKAFWYDLENAAKRAIRSPGDSFSVRDMARFDVVPDQTGRQWMRIRLPSGRFLCYPDPAIEHDDCDRCEGTGEVLYEHAGVEHRMKCPQCGGSGKRGWERIVHMGMNQYTRKWSKLDTFGGKISENWTQAVARDVFFSGFRKAMRAGYFVVLRVHDELVCEVPDDASLSHETLSALMSENPGWTAGLPLSAAGFEAYRYRKE